LRGKTFAKVFPRTPFQKLLWHGWVSADNMRERLCIADGGSFSSRSEVGNDPYGFARSRFMRRGCGTCRLPSLRERVDMPLRGNRGTCDREACHVLAARRGQRPLQVCANSRQTVRLRWPSPRRGSCPRFASASTQRSALVAGDRDSGG